MYTGLLDCSDFPLVLHKIGVFQLSYRVSVVLIPFIFIFIGLSEYSTFCSHFIAITSKILFVLARIRFLLEVQAKALS